MDILDKQGKTVHYSGDWEAVSFTNGLYKPGKSFRLFVETSITLTIKGILMKRKDATTMTLTEGYHNFVCDEIIESGSDTPNGVFALF